MSYTDKMTDRINEVAEQLAAEGRAFNFEEATKLQEEPLFHSVTARSIVGKVKAEGLPYERIVRLTKTGVPVAQKNELIHKLEVMLALTEGSLEGLEKSTKAALSTLVYKLREVQAELETLNQELV